MASARCSRSDIHGGTTRPGLDDPTPREGLFLGGSHQLGRSGLNGNRLVVGALDKGCRALEHVGLAVVVVVDDHAHNRRVLLGHRCSLPIA
jgi:hypothetical protein